MAEVLLPQLGETVTEGTITRWAKQVGDAVARDEVLFEVSTDKVDSEVPSPEGGVLTEIRVPEGETVTVGTVLAVISESGEGAAPAAPTSNATVSAPADEDRQAPAPTTTPAGPGSTEEPALSSATQGSSRITSPIVRKLLNTAGIDASQVTGTGSGGRITREDAEQAIANPDSRGAGVGNASGGGQATALTARPAAMPIPRAGTRDTVIPFNKIRQKTAEHMMMSKATSAHTLVSVEVDYANVDKVRAKRKAAFKQEEGVSLTYLPFIARALIDAIREFPHANASVGDNELIVHHDVNLSIAVDLHFEGLLVPVVQQADGLRLRQLSRGIADLATRARTRKLQASDIQGGTFTITNAGGYGTVLTYPVINQPQVAILSTDGIKKRPVVVTAEDGSDAIAIHPVGILALAWDHRAFDGAYAAAFLARVRDLLETRDWSQEF